ncbi:MAG: hypothetical protein JTT11_00475, partial [Candidatus Brockarchaeota archaeon]|nr:hypothetical protein [Candidatus Brockarchaeota archaeon]
MVKRVGKASAAEIPSSCVYCGVGCRIRYVVEGGKIRKALPDPGDAVSEGSP